MRTMSACWLLLSMPRISEISNDFSESLIHKIGAQAQELGAINLAQALPDAEVPAALKKRAVSAINANRNQLADLRGLPALREAVAYRYEQAYELRLDPHDHITITNGATEAMLAALLAVVDPGDEVIVFEPTNPNYRPQILMARGVPVYVPLDESNGSFDPRTLANAFSEKTAAIIVCNPNVPLGKVFGRDELETIAQLCVRHDAVAIADEAYEYFTYGGRPHICLGAIADFRDRSIVITSCSKSYMATGWRVGCAVGSMQLSKAFRRCHEFIAGPAPTPFQEAAAAAFRADSSYYQALLELFERKRVLLAEVLNNVGLKCSLPEGAWYVSADMSSFDYKDAAAFCVYLLKDVGVAAVPYGAFYHGAARRQTKVRFSFSRSERIIEDAGKRLSRML